MLTLLSRLFIPDYENYSSPKVRQAYGILTGSVGIFFNFFLFVLKIVAGMISHSIVCIHSESLIHYSSLMNFLIFLLRLDYIFILFILL